MGLSQFGQQVAQNQAFFNFTNLTGFQTRLIRLMLSKSNICSANFAGKTIDLVNELDVTQISGQNRVLFSKGNTVDRLLNNDAKIKVDAEQPGKNFIGQLTLEFGSADTVYVHGRSKTETIYLSMVTDASNAIISCRAIAPLSGAGASTIQCPVGELAIGFDPQGQVLCQAPPTSPGPSGTPTPPKDCSASFKHGDRCSKTTVTSTKTCVAGTCDANGTIYPYTCPTDTGEHYKCFDGTIVKWGIGGAWCNSASTLNPLTFNDCPF